MGIIFAYSALHPGEQPVKTWRKIAYSAGSLGTAVSYQAFANRIQYLYIDVLGIQASIIGVVWSLYGIWNAINDPLMGQLSDRTRTRWGRRIPFIMFGSIPLGILFVLLWTPPTGSVTLTVAYFALIVFAFDTLWSLIVIAWTALFPEMYSDLRERAAVSGWRQAFSVIGLIFGLALPPVLIENFGWVGMGAIVAFITVASFLISLLGSREDTRHLPEKDMSFWDAMKATLANKSFDYFLIANLAKELIFLLMVAVMPFYAKYVVKLTDGTEVLGTPMDAATQESLLLGVPFLLSVPMLVVWTAIARRVGSRRAWQYASIAFMPGLFLVLIAQDFHGAILATSVLALGLPGLLMMSDLLIADIVDEDELRTGHRREGAYFGVNGAVIRLAFALQGILFTFILPLTGYTPPPEGQTYIEQPVSAITGFRVLIAVVPFLALLVTIGMLELYPLHGERLAEVKRAVAEKHRSE